MTLLAAAALTSGLFALAVPASAETGPIRGTDAKGAIADSYIVVYNNGHIAKGQVKATTDRLATRHRATVKYRYEAALRGFAGQMSRAQAEKLAADPAVAFVEQDAEVTLSATQSPTPSWGLDRSDQRDLPLNESYSYLSTGSGVRAYVIDTGIRTSHTDFGGRAAWGTNTVDSNNTDCNGHGTHVAGTLGGTAYGVAKTVNLVAVKVLDCSGSGTNSGVIAGVNWVTSNHVKPAVANLSLGGGTSSALDTAVRNSITSGVTYAVASGNSRTNACNVSPARVAEAITVNASTRTDARASFSNYGSCTDIFAPGEAVTSAWHTGDTATDTISGTSMASPHVAGAAARILSDNPAATPTQVWNTMLANATTNKIASPGTGSPNRLLYLPGDGGTPSPSTTPTPTGCVAASNGTDVTVPDNGTATSPITIANCPGTASATATVEVHIVHTYIGDLVVDLVAPDGSVYNLHNRSGGSADNINQTYSRNLSAEAANGTWTLRVRDAATADVGRIDSWTLDL